MFKELTPAAIGIRGLALPDAIALARQTGFDSVDLDIRVADAIDDDGGPDTIVSLFARADILPGHWSLPVFWRDDALYETHLAELPELAAFGRDIGCTRVTSGVRPFSDERPYQENFDWHVARLRPIAEVLRAADCRLGLEFIGPRTFRAGHRHEFIYTLDGVLDLARAIGTGNVGLVLDAWHLYTSGGSVDDLDKLTNDDVVTVHVNDAPAGVALDEQIDSARELPLATGVIDLPGFMARLRAIGYDGPVMVEPFSAALSARAAADPTAAAREAAAALDRLWQL